jgi:hypothetical protein
MTDAPRRIQRSRARGWKMPENTVYVGRPSAWGNPFGLRDFPDAADAVERYRAWITSAPGHAAMARELRGRNLACWCRLDQPCHADVLLELANAPLRCEAVHD